MSFPILSDIKNTLANWSPKLVAIVEDVKALITPLSWGTWAPIPYGNGSLVLATPTKSVFWYFRLYKAVFILAYFESAASGTANASIRFTLPMKAFTDQTVETFAGSGSDASTIALFGNILDDRITVSVRRYDGGTFAASGTKVVRLAGFYRIE